MKKCSRCPKSKESKEFGNDKSTKDGLKSWCRTCCNEDYRNRYDANIDKYRKDAAERQDTYRKKSPKWKTSLKIYKKSNAGIINSLISKRRAIKLNATPNWLSEEQLNEIRWYYTTAKELQWLSNPLDRLEVDHIVPLQGDNVCGLHVPWNLQILPKSVNLSKGNKLK